MPTYQNLRSSSIHLLPRRGDYAQQAARALLGTPHGEPRVIGPGETFVAAVEEVPENWLIDHTAYSPHAEPPIAKKLSDEPAVD